MNDIVYSFNGKDITMNGVFRLNQLSIYCRINLLSFEEAAMRFISQKHTKLCRIQIMYCKAESAEYIRSLFGRD